MCNKSELHKQANADTPKGVAVLNTWPALITWVLGRWGVGAVGFVLMAIVYVDLRTANQNFAKITTENVRVLESLANKIEMTNRLLYQATK